jgi:hypothetical protein
MKRNQRIRGMYVLGARARGKNRVLGHMLTLQDNLAGIPLVMSDPRGKTLSELVKEVLTDATKNNKDSSQPKP